MNNAPDLGSSVDPVSRASGQDLLIQLETALNRLVESFWDEPYRYFTAADAHVGLQTWLARRPELMQTVQTEDEFETGLLHREYPTFFRFHDRSPTERLQDTGSRGHYDLVIIDPAHVRNQPAERLMNRRIEDRADLSQPPLLAAVEFKLFTRGWSPLRLRGVRSDVGKLRLTLQPPAHACAAYLCVFQRVASRTSTRSDNHWRTVRKMLEDASDIRAVVAVCWPKQPREPFVHYSGPWI